MFLASTDQVAARRAKRMTLHGVGAESAVRVARQTFKEAIDRPTVGSLKSGRTADEYVNDFAARVKGAAPDGSDALVLSGTPLQDKNAAGRIAPVDISLQREATGGWAPKNPLEPYRISPTATGGVRFDGGLTVSPVGDASKGSVEGETVFYVETQTDTDSIIKPLTDGAEFFWQLRSARSPEQLSLSVDLPPGAAFAEPGPDGVRIVTDGKPVAAIGAAMALDANGLPVKTTMKVSGDTVSIFVDHRGADVAYPILVDPPVTAGFYFPYQGLDAFDYWSTWQNGRQDVWGGDGTYGRGLNIRSQNYPEYIAYNDGDSAGMYVNAPGNAHIYKIVNTLSRNITGEYLAMCLHVGLANAAVNNWEGPYGQAWGEGCAPFASFSWIYELPGQGGTPGNSFVFSSYRYSATPTAFHQYFQDAELWMVDPDNPGISSFGVPGEWVNGIDDEWINVLAGDASTGIKSITLAGPAGWSGAHAYVNPYCEYGPCTPQFDIGAPVDNMPEGLNQITVSAADPAGNTSPPWTKTVKVDRTGPVISLSGSLWNARNQPTDHRQEGVFEQWENLQMQASDALSGVGSIEVFVDDVSVAGTIGCDGGAVCTDGGDIDTHAYADGDHELRAVATDVAGNISETTFIVRFDTRGDVYQAIAATGDPDAEGEVLDFEAVRLASHQSRFEVSDSVSTRTNVPCDEADPTGPQCPEARFRTYDSEVTVAQPGDQDTFASLRGAVPSDPNIPEVVGLFDAINYIALGLQPSATGDILIVTQPWQRLPSAHGTTYELYETTSSVDINDGTADPTTGEFGDATSSQTVTTKTWIDAVTQLPIKQSTVQGSATDTVYISYSGNRAEVANLPADYFRVADPAVAGLRQQTRFGEETMATSDNPSATAVPSYGIAPALLPTAAECLLTTAAFEHHEEPLPGDLDAAGIDIARTNAYYGPTPSGGCHSGSEAAGDARIVVSSFPASSTAARINREAIVPRSGAHNVRLRRRVTALRAGAATPPAVRAYVTKAPGPKTVFVDVGRTSVVINGLTTPEEATRIVAGLEPR
jgi:hypothetical protein